MPLSTLEEIQKYLDKNIKQGNTKELTNIKPWFQNLELAHWKNRVEFRKNEYNPITLINCDAYQLLLMCWNPSQGSSFHSPPAKGCLIKVLEGRLDDELQAEDKDSQFRIHMQNDVFFISNNMGQHRVFNSQDEIAVSLHLSAPGGGQK